MDALIGELRMFAGDYAPWGWEVCDGRAMAISDNRELFSVIGTTYGGDGVAWFNLPDLRGRVPLGVGDGPAQRTYPLAGADGRDRLTAPAATDAASPLRGSDGDNLMPYLAIHWIIATRGTYPRRP
jgi:microcystin-dependent protein